MRYGRAMRCVLAAGRSWIWRLAGPALFVACHTAPPPDLPRPTLHCPADLRTPARVAAPTLVRCERQADGIETGELEGAGERVHFTRWRTGQRHGDTPPIVLLVPILAGGEDLMHRVAEGLVERGFDVALCRRVASALKPPQRGPELEDLFRRTILHQRLLLAWLREQAGAPAEVCVMGLSLGGMVGTTLTAIEPSVRGVTVCLSGGDLGDLVTASSESRVQRWRDWRHLEDGVGDDHLRQELRQQLAHEPLRAARAVPTDKVLFVGGAFDTVVPEHHQDLLWEALGRPRRLTLPLGHYSAFLALEVVLDAAAEHFRGCLARRRSGVSEFADLRPVAPLAPPRSPRFDPLPRSRARDLRIMDVRIAAASLLFLATTFLADTAVAQFPTGPQAPMKPPAAQDPEKATQPPEDPVVALSREKARLEREIEYARARVVAARGALAAKFQRQERTWREIDAGTLAQTNTAVVTAKARPQTARVAAKAELETLGTDGMLLVNGAVIRRPLFDSVMDYLRTVPNTGTDEQRAPRVLMDLIRTEVANAAFPDSEAMVIAGHVVKRLANGSTPAEMARMYGVIPGASPDGRLEIMRNSALGPVLEQAAFTTKVGEATTPIRTSMGAVVLKVAAFEKGASPELDKVQLDAIVVPYTQDSFALQSVLETAMAGQVQIVGRDSTVVEMLPVMFRPVAARAKSVDKVTLQKTMERLEAERERLEALLKERPDEALRMQVSTLKGQIEKTRIAIENADKEASATVPPQTNSVEPGKQDQGKK